MARTLLEQIEFNRRIRIVKLVIAAILIISPFIYVTYEGYNKVEVIENVKVFSTSTVMHINGDVHDTYSQYTYYVNTDKGVFEISPDGIYATKVFGTLKNDSVYTITTRGFNFPQWGFHPHIIDAK